MRANSLVAGGERTARLDDIAIAPSIKSVLVVDVGGTSVKILATGQSEPRSFPSGPTMTPGQMISEVKKLTEDWNYDAVSIGYPGPVVGGRPIMNPYNLGRGWVGFDFGEAFDRPVKVINDAAMQALGSYRGGKMLFLGLGTGLGSTVIADGVVEPMELGHLPYKKRTYEAYVGRAGLMRHGKKRWRNDVADVVARLVTALEPDETVLGGGNVKKLETLPPNCRAGDNVNAFRGGFKLWEATPLSREPELVRNEAPGGAESAPRPNAKAETFSGRSTSNDAAWRALEAHHANMRGQRLRDLFSDDPTRGERMTAQAAGVFLDYSKNRIPDETLRLLIELAEESGLRAKIEAMFRGEKINMTENRAVLHVALRAPKGAAIIVDGVNVVPQVHAVLDKMADFANASEAASGKATPANAFATSSISASAAPTSGR